MSNVVIVGDLKYCRMWNTYGGLYCGARVVIDVPTLHFHGDTRDLLTSDPPIDSVVLFVGGSDSVGTFWCPVQTEAMFILV